MDIESIRLDQRLHVVDVFLNFDVVNHLSLECLGE